jgi:ferredoxin-NADP reductase
MPIRWYDATVIGIMSLTPNTRQFTLKIEDVDHFSFIPGQFITLDLPVSEKRLDRWRSYSIASSPSDTNTIELCIVKSENGLGTKYLFEACNIGTVLKFKGPDGSFILPQELNQELIMLCTGTGIAPFRSMIDYVDQNNINFNKLHLVFGTRYASGLLYWEQWQNLAQKHPNFFFDFALSREQSQAFHHGYIHDIYLNKYSNVSDNRIFYICGWSGMVDQAVENIINMGYNRSQIKFELYG